jgi:hypothetical protein
MTLSISLISLFVTVKATGVILLLGVGSLVCYKICNHYWPRSRPPSSPRPRTRPKGTVVVSHAQDSEDQLLEDLEDEELSEVEVSNESH